MRRESQEQRPARGPVRLRRAPGGGSSGAVGEAAAAGGAAAGQDTLDDSADTLDSAGSADGGTAPGADTLDRVSGLLA